MLDRQRPRRGRGKAKRLRIRGAGHGGSRPAGPAGSATRRPNRRHLEHEEGKPEHKITHIRDQRGKIPRPNRRGGTYEGREPADTTRHDKGIDQEQPGLRGIVHPPPADRQLRSAAALSNRPPPQGSTEPNRRSARSTAPSRRPARTARSRGATPGRKRRLSRHAAPCRGDRPAASIGLGNLVKMGFPDLRVLGNALAPGISPKARQDSADARLCGAAVLLSSNCYKTDTFGSCKLTTSGVEAAHTRGPDIQKSMETTCPT